MDKSDSKKEKPKEETAKSSTAEIKAPIKDDKTIKAEKVEIKEEQLSVDKKDEKDKNADAKVVEESL